MRQRKLIEFLLLFVGLGFLLEGYLFLVKIFVIVVVILVCLAIIYGTINGMIGGCC